MYHFVWVDQKEKQGYKFNVSLKRGIQLMKGTYAHNPNTGKHWLLM